MAIILNAIIISCLSIVIVSTLLIINLTILTTIARARQRSEMLIQQIRTATKEVQEQSNYINAPNANATAR